MFGRITTWLRGSITRRVAFFAAAMTLLVMVSLSAVTYVTIRGMIEQRIAAELRSRKAEITGKLEGVLQGIGNDVSSLASNMLVVNTLIDSAGRDAYILPFLRTHRLSAGIPTGIILCDFQGKPIASNLSGPGIPSFSGNRVLLDAVIGNARPVVLLKGSDEGLSLILAYPLIYPATGMPEGMLVAETRLHGLLEELGRELGAGMVFELRAERTGPSRWRTGAISGEPMIRLSQRLLLKPPLDALGLEVGIGTAAGSAYAPLERLTMIYLAGGLVLLLAIIAMSLWMARALTRPLAGFSAAAHRIAETGSISLRLPVEGHDEIASLAASFNTMLAQLQGSAESLEQRVQERTRELALLNESLRNSETFIASILNNVDEGFIVVDRDYHIVAANHAYCKQTARALKDVLGRPCYTVSHYKDRPCFELGEDCAVRRVYESGVPHSSLHVHDGPNGAARHVETRAFPLSDSSGKIISAIEVITDITGKVHLEEQLRQAQKMEAVGMLAGGIAHDFNNILTAIVGYGNILKIKMRPDDPLGGYVEQVLQSAARATSLTQGLLTFSRKQMIVPKALDLNEVVVRFESFLRRVLGEDIELTIRPSGGELIIMADMAQVEQIIMNLATNARDAMPRGGRLTIATGKRQVDDDFVRDHGVRAEGEFAQLSISDTGEGMDEQTRQRIFEPFFTTKELGRGTGLGLSIVYGAVQQNHGFIVVESEPGKGSQFLVYFPLIKKTRAKGPEPEAGPLKGGTETILVAEDEKNLRTLAATVLREFGYEVIEAEDGADAIEKFSSNRDRISLALLDVVMPRKNGKEAGDEIRRLKPGIRVLYMSGYSADIVSGKGIIARNETVLAKPFPPGVLLNRIRELLDAA